ncbi:hypothetical protein [Brachybacterium saurashtrense]|uniref:Helicase n=1 Tax=Brachybacterium saurashtrense TaxID=556288 RepID=A0A345YQV0_9MICO|nr:hypothetical protein [Brachybacterium saurashtrense]AXK46302.1 hypothetical protein DWV08_12235 [Brachybacterium saurashtrense]RRR24042.1 hypothetical protein DXU92_03985 [Brachybacterium saurashtrense]
MTAPAPPPSTMTLAVGGLAHDPLQAELAAAGVALNAHARTLLADPRVDGREPVAVTLARRTVAALGLPQGGTLPQLLEAAGRCGLRPCPPSTGPYLRLALTTQEDAPDSVLSAGKVPSGALHVLSSPLVEDHDYPKGFYLRVVDGVPWLRGFRCDDEYCWPPESELVLEVPPTG